MLFNVQALKVGDAVGFGRGHNYDDGFGNVEKINGHGHVHVITDNGVQVVFDKHGSERGKNYGNRHLCDAASLRQAHERRDANRAKQELLNRLADCRCGNGDYHVTDEAKAHLVALVNAI